MTPTLPLLAIVLAQPVGQVPAPEVNAALPMTATVAGVTAARHAGLTVSCDYKLPTSFKQGTKFFNASPEVYEVIFTSNASGAPAPQDITLTGPPLPY